MKKHKIEKILALLFLMIFLWICSKGPKPFIPRFTLRIEGVITDAITNSPIADAFAQLYDFRAGYSRISPHIVAEVKTDENGYYYIEYSEVGTLELSYVLFRMGAMADGYCELDIWTQGKCIDCTEEVQTINIQLEPKSN